MGIVESSHGDPNWRTYPENFTGYSRAETVIVSKDSQGRYWFGTRTNGVDLYQPKH